MQNKIVELNEANRELKASNDSLTEKNANLTTHNEQLIAHNNKLFTRITAEGEKEATPQPEQTPEEKEAQKIEEIRNLMREGE